MSERIKLNFKQNNFNVKVKNGLSEAEDTQTNEDFLQAQMQRQYELGYSKGYDTAINELEKSYSEKLVKGLTDIHTIASALEKTIKDHEEYYESVLIQLSLLIAEKIIKREVAQKTIIDDVMRESLKKIIGANNIVVKLNTDDFNEMSSQAKELMSDSAFNKIKFEPDPRVELGGCFIESEIGNVDARIASQLNELKRNMDLGLYQQT